jgi:hypothetical protein
MLPKSVASKKSLLQSLCILPESKGIIRHGFVALLNLSGVEDNVIPIVDTLGNARFITGRMKHFLGLGELKHALIFVLPGPRKTLTKSDAGTVLIDAFQIPPTDAKTQKTAQEALKLLWSRD